MPDTLKFTGKVDGTAIKNLIKKLKKLRAPVDKTTAKKAAKGTLKEMKKLIASGTSPIRGNGKMPRYHGSYAAQIKKKGYVSVKGRKYDKKMRPVNLKLTGKFLDNLKSRVIKVSSGFGISIGYRKKSEKLKERGHREGHNNQRIRPTIPQENRGEEFALRIQREFITILNEAIGKITKKKG